jgi:hypothetical protein
MGMAGVGDLLVPAGGTCSKRRRACERVGSEVDHGAGGPAVGRSTTPFSSLHAIGRSTNQGFCRISRHL